MANVSEINRLVEKGHQRLEYVSVLVAIWSTSLSFLCFCIVSITVSKLVGGKFLRICYFTFAYPGKQMVKYKDLFCFF